MNKLIKVVAASVCAVSLSAIAAEDSSTKAAPKAASEPAPEAALEEEETQVFEAGFDFDYFSAYVWRNSVQSDDMVMQPAVWADLTYFEPFWLGFSIWQNYDLTDRRRAYYTYGYNETDYNVHLGATVWTSEDEEMELGLEIGHDWMTYAGVKDEARESSPDTYEVYVKATFDNPIVNVYGQIAYMYRDFGEYQQGLHYEIGFNKEIELCDSVNLGADWNVNFGDAHYLTFLYGGTASGAYYHEDEDETYDDYASQSAGIGGTTVKIYLTWDITDYLQLGATIAYTGILSQPHREAIGDQGDDYGWDGDSYARDLLWGGLSLKLSY